MKSFEQPAAALVRRLTEDIDDDEFGDDIKDVIEIGQENHWYQIDGDANPWIWGGSWYNPAENEILHFDGIDQDGTKEIEDTDVEVPEQVLAAIRAKIHDPYLDTEEAKEDPAWLQRMLRQEENEIELMANRYQVARAEFLNNRLEHTFYQILVPPPTDWIFKKYTDVVKSQFDEETQARFDSWPLPVKLMEIARYIGVSQIGDPIKLTYKEANAKLGGIL